jgi:hypothetical protein
VTELVTWTDPEGVPHEIRPAQRFWHEVTESGEASCWVAYVLNFKWQWANDGSLSSPLHCDGRIQAAHIVAKRHVKREYPMGVEWRDGWVRADHWSLLDETTLRSLDEIVYDPRNGLPACGRHHHLVDSKVIQFGRQDLPMSDQCAYEVEAFITDYPALRSYFEREYGERVAA